MLGAIGDVHIPMSGLPSESRVYTTDATPAETFSAPEWFTDLPIIQDFGLFADTMGFMGMDLVEPVDSGNFMHYGSNMSFADARATVDGSHPSAPHHNRRYTAHHYQAGTNS